MRLYGFNILTGLAITAKHFARTYTEDFKRWFGFKKRQRIFRNKPEDVGSFTVQYPDEKLPVPERFRMLPVLIYEEGDGDVRCTACGICAKVCPPQCIWIVQAKDPTGKPKPKVSQFTIDMDVCMNCGFCAEFCPFDAIKMDHQFELSNYERKRSHVYGIQDLLVSTDYYAKSHPVAWAKELAVKEEEERKKKAKEEAAAAAAAKKKTEEAAAASAAEKRAEEVAAEAAARKKAEDVAAEAAARKKAEDVAAEAAARKKTEETAVLEAADKKAEEASVSAAGDRTAEEAAPKPAAKRKRKSK